MQTFDDFGKPADAGTPPASAHTAPAPSPAQSDQTRKFARLAAALAKAQGMIKPPAKNRTVDFLDKNGRRVFYKYADLADVIECCREPLSANELAVTHRLNYGARGYGMTTEVLHSSGESMATWYPLPDPATQAVKPQEFGSALTYARRYSLSAILGIASEEDDDGGTAPPANHQQTSGPASGPVIPAAGGPSTREQGPPVNQPDPKASRRVTEPQLTRLFTIASKTGWTNEFIHEYVATRWKLESTKELTMARYDDLVSIVQRKTPQQAYATILQEKQL